MPKSTEVEVWDVLVRLLHWSLVLSFAAAYISGDGWRKLHVSAGYAATILIAVRVVWGIVGPRYARFSHFVKPPALIAAYLRRSLQGRVSRHLGHNPAGGAMILMLMLVLSAVSVSGVLLTTDAFWGSQMMDTLHGSLAHICFVLIAVHVAGVIFTSIRTRENLVWSMITGRKRAPDGEDVV